MTEPHIERFGPDVSVGALIEAVDRDGCAMVHDALTPEELSALNADFDTSVASAGESAWSRKRIEANWL